MEISFDDRGMGVFENSSGNVEAIDLKSIAPAEATSSGENILSINRNGFYGNELP